MAAPESGSVVRLLKAIVLAIAVITGLRCVAIVALSSTGTPVVRLLDQVDTSLRR